MVAEERLFCLFPILMFEFFENSEFFVFDLRCTEFVFVAQLVWCEQSTELS